MNVLSPNNFEHTSINVNKQQAHSLHILLHICIYITGYSLVDYSIHLTHASSAPCGKSARIKFTVNQTWPQMRYKQTAKNGIKIG